MARVTMLTLIDIDCDLETQYVDITFNPNILDFHSLRPRYLDTVYQYVASIECGT